MPLISRCPTTSSLCLTSDNNIESVGNWWKWPCKECWYMKVRSTLRVKLWTFERILSLSNQLAACTLIGRFADRTKFLFKNTLVRSRLYAHRKPGLNGASAWDAGRRVARISQRGGGAFMRDENNSKWTWPKFSSVLNQIEAIFQSKSDDLLKKRSSSKLNRFFRPKLGDLQKKEKDLHQDLVTSPDQLWVCSRKQKLHFSSPNNNKSFTTSTPQSRWGRLFSFLSKNRPQKH